MSLIPLKAGRRKLAAALVVVACAATAPVAATAQTVEDYEAALTAAAASGKPAESCPPLVNYTFVSMSADEKVDPTPLFGLIGAAFGAGGTADAADVARDACRALLKTPIIVFDGGSGQDIVAQPAVEDPNKPIGAQRPVY